MSDRSGRVGRLVSCNVESARLSFRIKLAVVFAVLVGVGCGASTYVYLDAAARAALVAR